MGCVCVCLRQLGIMSGNSDEVGRKKLKTMGRQKPGLLKWSGGQFYFPNSLGTAPATQKKQPSTFPEVDLTCLCGFGFGAVMRALNTELELQGLAQVLLLSDKRSICTYMVVTPWPTLEDFLGQHIIYSFTCHSKFTSCPQALSVPVYITWSPSPGLYFPFWLTVPSVVAFT